MYQDNSDLDQVCRLLLCTWLLKSHRDFILVESLVTNGSSCRRYETLSVTMLDRVK
jgi:hypothetical protein